MPRYHLTGYSAIFTIDLDAPDRRSAHADAAAIFAAAVIAVIPAPGRARARAREVGPLRETDGAIVVTVNGLPVGLTDDPTGEHDGPDLRPLPHHLARPAVALSDELARLGEASG